MRTKLALLILLCSVPALAAPAKDWLPYEPPSRLFHMDMPPEGWNAFEEDDALGSVVHVFGPDDPSGTLRATLSIRLVDRDTPNFLPAKEAVEAMRQSQPGRDVTAVRPLRLTAGLARVFEIVETRRLPIDSAPSAPVTLHQYVAVIPRGADYFLVRLITARANYLDYREDFIRLLKSFRPIGSR